MLESQGAAELRILYGLYVWSFHGPRSTNPCAAYSVFSDFMPAVFPVTVIWDLQIKWKLKLNLAFYMRLGALYESVARIFHMTRRLLIRAGSNAGIASIIKMIMLKTLFA